MDKSRQIERYEVQWHCSQDHIYELSEWREAKYRTVLYPYFINWGISRRGFKKRMDCRKRVEYPQITPSCYVDAAK